MPNAHRSEGPGKRPGHQVSSLPAACWTWYCNGTGDDRLGGTPWLSGLHNWHKIGPEPSTCNVIAATMRRQILKIKLWRFVQLTKTKPRRQAFTSSNSIETSKNNLKTGSKISNSPCRQCVVLTQEVDQVLADLVDLKARQGVGMAE